MRSFRRRFGAGLYRLMGGTGNSESRVAGREADADSRLAIRFWFGAVVLVVVLTFVLVALVGNSVGIQTVLAALWGLLIGGGLLFFIHKKLIITVAGALIGAGASEIKGVVEGVKSMAKVAQDVTDSVNGIFGPAVQFYIGPVVVFFIVILVSCIPAYRE
jgi:hypothetical protein